MVLKNMKKLIQLNIFISLLFMLCSSAFAFHFNVDPSRVELMVNRGEKKNGYISVYNTDPNNTIHVRAYVQDLVYLPDGSNNFLAPGTTPWSCADWIILRPQEFDIAPNKEQVVKFQI